MRNQYNIHFPKIDYVKKAHRWLDIKIMKEVVGIKVQIFLCTCSKSIRIWRTPQGRESPRKSLPWYLFLVCKFEEVEVANMHNMGSFTCPLMVKKAPNIWKRPQNTWVPYTFDVGKTKENLWFLGKREIHYFVPGSLPAQIKKNRERKSTVSIITHGIT